jgi:hypothetical protein
MSIYKRYPASQLKNLFWKVIRDKPFSWNRE